MALFPPTDDDQAHVREISELFVTGAVLLHRMLTEKDTTSFDNWATRLCKMTGLKNDRTTSVRLMWLWDALRTEPELSQKFGELPPSTAPWRGTYQPRKVFEAGEWFIIGFNGGAINDLLKHPHKPASEEIVAVKTLGDLWMRSGKGGHLECCDCQAEVTIQVPEVFELVREADIMEIDPKRIALGHHTVKVLVDSLNQAYTIASRRLEPKRRSHGGRIYDHLIHAGHEKRTLLEEIRLAVEKDDWRIPFTSSRSVKPAH